MSRQLAVGAAAASRPVSTGGAMRSPVEAAAPPSSPAMDRAARDRAARAALAADALRAWSAPAQLPAGGPLLPVRGTFQAPASPPPAPIDTGTATGRGGDVVMQGFRGAARGDERRVRR